MPRYPNPGLAQVAKMTTKSAVPNQNTVKGPAKGTTVISPKAQQVPLAKVPNKAATTPLKKAPLGKPESNRGAAMKQIDVENKSVNTYGVIGTTGKQKMPRYK